MQAQYAQNVHFDAKRVAFGRCGLLDAPVNTNVGAMIRAARDGRGWTQTQLAQAADVSLSTIQKMEASATRLVERQTFRSVAEALGMSPGAIDPEWFKGADVKRVHALPVSAEVLAALTYLGSKADPPMDAAGYVEYHALRSTRGVSLETPADQSPPAMPQQEQGEPGRTQQPPAARPRRKGRTQSGR